MATMATATTFRPRPRLAAHPRVPGHPRPVACRPVVPVLRRLRQHRVLELRRCHRPMFRGHLRPWRCQRWPHTATMFHRDWLRHAARARDRRGPGPRRMM